MYIYTNIYICVAQCLVVSPLPEMVMVPICIWVYTNYKSMCIYMYICIYVSYMYIYIYTYIHIQIQIQIHRHIHIHIHPPTPADSKGARTNRYVFFCLFYTYLYVWLKIDPQPSNSPKFQGAPCRRFQGLPLQQQSWQAPLRGQLLNNALLQIPEVLGVQPANWTGTREICRETTGQKVAKLVIFSTVSMDFLRQEGPF